jgi:hypothetical protein
VPGCTEITPVNNCYRCGKEVCAVHRYNYSGRHSCAICQFLTIKEAKH